MRRRGTRRRRIIVADHECAVGDLGQALAAPARNETCRERGVLEIDRDRVVDDPAQTGGRYPPAICTAILVEPSVNGVEPLTQSARWNGDPDPHRKSTFGICDHRA